MSKHCVPFVFNQIGKDYYCLGPALRSNSCLEFIFFVSNGHH
jgi:hypothetical protein